MQSFSTRVTFARAIERGAALTPDKLFVTDGTGAGASYAQMDERARLWEAALGEAGVGTGDRVAVIAPARVEALAVWAGTARRRAWFVPINNQLIGATLAHALATADPKVVVVHADMLEAVAQTLPAAQAPGVVVVLDHPGPLPEAAAQGPIPVTAEEFLALPASVRAAPDVELTEVYGLLFTSGTTGPSKAVMATWSYLHLLHQGGVPFDALGSDDVWYAPLPLNHAAGQGLVFMAASKGGTVVLRDRVSISRFWDDVRAHEVTATILMGMWLWLANEAPSPADADHKQVLALCGPLPGDVQELERRFNLKVFTLFGMSEVASPIVSGLSPTDTASAGFLREEFEARLVADDGSDAGDGPGELWVRCSIPGAVTPGYFGRPDATAEAISDGWLKTGDIFRRRDDGAYCFVDRRADSIRRSGESISSREVEIEVAAHPLVLECAAVAVPDETRGHEVGVQVVLVPGAELTAQELINWLGPRMPRFMLPRYVRFTDELPRTPNGKLIKKGLGIVAGAPGVWDVLEQR